MHPMNAMQWFVLFALESNRIESNHDTTAVGIMVRTFSSKAG